MMSRVQVYMVLAAAIVAEVIGTTALARSEGFSKLLPSLVAVLGYAVALWLLSFALRTMPTGIVYAVWAGLGIVLITAVAWFWSDQALDLPAVIGLTLIVAGVIFINLFSKTISH